MRRDGSRPISPSAGAVQTLTMFFGVQDDVKSDDVTSLLSRGGPQSPNHHPDTCRTNPARTPSVPDLFSRGFGFGHLNVSVTKSPIGSCRAGLGFGVRPNGTGEPRLPSRPRLPPPHCKLLEWSSYKQQSLA